MRRLLTPLVLVSALTVSACHAGSWSGPAVRGSGVLTEATRPVEAFDALEVAGSFEVLVEQGAPRELVVTGDDNLLPLVETRVEGGVLRVRTSRTCSSRLGLGLRIRTPELRRVALSGSHELELRGVHGAALVLEGSGSIRARGQGEVERLVLELSGSSEVELTALAAREAQVSASGSHDVALTARERLALELSGSSDVRYAGEPVVQVSAAGSSSVRRQ